MNHATAEEAARAVPANGGERKADRDLPVQYRLLLLILGFVALGLGVAAGLARLGWNAPLPYPGLTALHGPLMVSGFFGTVISLERAVALRTRWAYGAPLFTALGAMTLISGASVTVGTALITFGSLVMVLASVSVCRRQRALFTATLALGAVAWLVGNGLWAAGFGMTRIVPWWAAYLILTIAGERLELSRFLPPSRTAVRLFSIIVAVFIAALILADTVPAEGHLLLALVLLILALWLARYDIARRTIREKGLTRFIAVSLLSGYSWLAIGAVVGLFTGGMFSQGAYDATLHAVFLGFVFSMVFGHAPIILPAVTRFAVPYRPTFYLHLALLHLSLTCRLAGDLLGLPDAVRIGGLLNAVTLAVFVLSTVAAVAAGLRNRAGAH